VDIMMYRLMNISSYFPVGYFICALFLLITITEKIHANEDTLSVVISAEQLISEEINLHNNHRYHDGHIEGAADLGFNDSDWQTGSQMSLSTSDLPDSWTGIRWYRVQLDVDPSLRNKTVALQLILIGAAEVWLNGEHVKTIGNPALDSDYFEYGDMHNWIPIQLSENRDQLLAFKFVNPRTEYFSNPFLTIPFNPSLSDLEHSRNEDIEQLVSINSVRWFFVGFFLVFGFTHLLIFLFNRNELFNLWFSITCFLFTFIVFVVLDFYPVVDPETRLLLHRMMQAALLLVFGFMALFLYSALSIKPSRIFYGLFLLSVIVAVIHIFIFTPGIFLLLVLGALLVYLSIKAFTIKQEGSVILGSGTLIFVISTFAVLILESLGYQPGEEIFSFIHLPFFGFGVALLSMSVFQSRSLSILNANLQSHLEEVKELSEKNLQQERSLRETEVEKAKLAIENERKTVELEKSRKLQLSLLPPTLPSSEIYDIAAVMRTATEVGGDYYDYIELGDGHFIWALGDATGHGSDAGLVVAMTKTLFQTITPAQPADEALRQISTELKKAGLKNHFMCLGLLEVNGSEIVWCSAGIPPAVIVRAGSNKIELLESKGMPLGSVTDFEYQKIRADLAAGDTLILISDGFMEQMNSEREQLGIDGLMDCLHRNDSQTADELIRSLNICFDRWKKDMEQQDDVTIVVVKKGKESLALWQK